MSASAMQGGHNDHDMYVELPTLCNASNVYAVSVVPVDVMYTA